MFDERARLAGPLNGIVGTPNDYLWSADNAAEVAAGWIVRADTPEALAEAIGTPELPRTLREYGGLPDEFGRADPTPLEPPLYAIETWPAVATASGGPRRDARARVLRPRPHADRRALRRRRRRLGVGPPDRARRRAGRCARVRADRRDQPVSKTQ